MARNRLRGEAREKNRLGSHTFIDNGPSDSVEQRKPRMRRATHPQSHGSGAHGLPPMGLQPPICELTTIVVQRYDESQRSIAGNNQLGAKPNAFTFPCGDTAVSASISGKSA